MSREKTVPAVLALVLLLLLFAISSCAQLGLVPAQTFNQRAAYAYGTVTAVRQAATGLLKEKRMSAAEGREVLVMTNSARTYLDLSLLAGDTADGNSKLQLANQVLLEVQRYLEKKAKESP